MAFSKPFYIKTRDCPKKVSTAAICKACERISGSKSMKAAMWDKGVWKLNAATDEARATLLSAGFIDMGGYVVRLFGDNPYITIDKDGKPIPSTKLVVDGIPVEMDGEVISRFLSKIGINTRSKLHYENAWDADTKTLSEWLTGKRFVYIDLPEKELKKDFKLGEFDVKLYYKEMEKETPRCKRCFGPHWTNTCKEEEKCLDCLLPGHRRGDPTCPKVIKEFGPHDDQNTDDANSKKEGDGPHDDENVDEANSKNEGDGPHDDENDNANSENEGDDPNVSDAYMSADEQEENAAETEDERDTEDIETEEKDDVNPNGTKENDAETPKVSGAAAQPAGAEGGQNEVNNGDKAKNVDKSKKDKPEAVAVNPEQKKSAKSKSAKNKQIQQNSKTQVGKTVPSSAGNKPTETTATANQERGRAQEKIDKFVQKTDRSVSKRRASKSPKHGSLDSKLRRHSVATDLSLAKKNETKKK